MKDTIRPFYSELQGYLVEAPPLSAISSNETSLAKNLNDLISKISDITKEDYARFNVKISPPVSPNQYDSIGSPAYFQVQEYRSNLSGLILRLHGQFFSNESHPFTGKPNTVINTTQMQSQSVDIQLLLTIQSKIDEQLPKFEDRSKEKNFLQTLKGSLVNIKDAAQLLSHLVTTAKNLGLSTDDLLKIFG